ncbi:choline ABC transporter permease [Bacillus canaveralius]|uniref:Choline ABC transporter permease n=1 Tax=Bacillus canaveralius TaxID=1403243 RepID=A0A2N5GMA9_9BACI|nr:MULTISPECIES: ABC transporter permease [Bacillus]PLR82975.1 choline ABC transporter permease [Bacillus canaveralius]PLR87946.1 choline ABC transporter permease [Bacillus sp. V33-4]PLR97021.1 choline ABC transporter permease [Bacillus canaveralius]
MELLQNYLRFLQQRFPDILARSGEHLTIVALAVLFGCLVAITTGIFLTRLKEGRLTSLVFGIINIFQTVPTIALLAMLIPLFGIGLKPAVFALFLYSLLPLLRNTYSGIKEVDESMIEAARGIGFSQMQRLWKIELPLAFPFILSGVRLTTVYIISWTTLAALIGAGGLGDLIIGGMANNDNFLIFTGTISAIILALIVDAVLGFVSRKAEQARA